MTERVRNLVKAAEMGFLRKVRDLSLFDNLKRTDICQSLRIEPFLLRIEQSQLCWYGRVTQMSYKRTAKQLMDALPSGKRPRWRPKTRWWDYAEDLAWLHLGIPPAKLPLVAGDRSPWRSQLQLLPPQTRKDKRAKRNTLN